MSGSPPIRPPRTGKKPVGLPTRGKTAPNRLRRADVFLSLYAPEFLRSGSGVFVDLGFGASAVTTLETRERLDRLRARMSVLGVEIDPERVAAALPFAGPGLDFRLGGFNLPLRAGENAAVIRALNVLRQYPEAQYNPSIIRMGSYLCEGGCLVEGTSDPTGGLMALNLFRRREEMLVFQGLVFSVRWRIGFSPRDLQAILPKNCIHHVEPGSPLDGFFTDWERVWPAFRGFRAAGIQLSIRELIRTGAYEIDPRDRFLRRGFVLLRRVPGIPDPSVPLLA